MPKAKNKSRRRPIKADDLFNLRIPTTIAMSPDESRVAYTVERMDRKDNKYYSNLFVCDLKGGPPRQFTQGPINDGAPVWSPTGDRLAFVSSRDKKTGIYLMSSDGGAEEQVIELEAAVSDLQWTPDGRQLLFCMRYRDSHYIKDEKKKKEAPVCRHITRLFYRYDGAGFEPQDTFQVYLLDIAAAKLRKITKGKRENTQACLSPDGKLVCYVSNRSKNQDVTYKLEDLFVIPLGGGRERKVPTPAGPIMVPVFSPDGKKIAYSGHDDPDDGWGITNVHVWTVGVTGRPKAKDLMPGFDRMSYDQSISDSGDMHSVSPLRWSADGKRVFFLASDTGATNLFAVPARGGRPTRLFKGPCHLKAFSVSGKTKRVALIHSDLSQPGEVVSCPTTYGAEKKTIRHTQLNNFLHTDVQLGKTRSVTFPSFDGTRVQGWLVLPPNFNPKRRYPSILEIHGGPRVQYAHTFFHEMQYLAARGFVVFYTNPRGGAGHGETWSGAIRNDWGGLDYKDCLAAADYLVRQKFIHPRRMGVTGGSYGGYMTNWIIGHTNRFAAAVTQRSVVDLKSFYGTSDVGWALSEEFDGPPWKNPKVYEQCSPMTYFKNVRTPVLIIHSEQDLRCNIEQAEQMFVMLKMLGKKVEMVRFPEEPHGLSRHGRPDRRVARLEWIDKWFRKYLK